MRNEKKSPERLLVHMDFSCDELGVRTLEFFHKNNHSPLGNELLRMADICTIYGCEEMCSFVHVGAPLTDTACMDSRVRFWGLSVCWSWARREHPHEQKGDTPAPEPRPPDKRQ